jgi:hypothetical protein
MAKTQFHKNQNVSVKSVSELAELARRVQHPPSDDKRTS